MLQHIQYELIQDLYKKLSLYKNKVFEKEYIYDFKNGNAQIALKFFIQPSDFEGCMMFGNCFFECLFFVS